VATQQPAGVLALSTYLPLREPPRQDGLAVFQAHGEYDDIIPLPVATDTHRYLESIGAVPEWHQYPMAHSLCADEVTDIRAWLMARMSA
jgi:phospholipase/carboxylesterase